MSSSQPIKQIAHYTPPDDLLNNPCVMQCNPTNIYKREKHYPGISIIHHQLSTNLGGTNYQCNNCHEKFSSS